MHHWYVFTDFEQASQQVADYLASTIQDCINHNGECHVILPGGNTPAKSLSLLARKSLAWDKVHWYLGDERCLPPDDEDRNDLMLEKNFWAYLPATHIHRIPAELGAEVASTQYRDEIKQVSRFDIAYLGMGEDGHTASLFPGHEALQDDRSVIPVYHSPKPPSDRVSLGLDTLRNTKLKVVLVSGASKAQVINRVKSGEQLPINSIGDIQWFLDEAANT